MPPDDSSQASILQNQIIFRKKGSYPIYWINGTSNRVCYSGLNNKWMISRSNNKWRVSDLMEILEYIEESEVQEEVVFHLDEIRKL